MIFFTTPLVFSHPQKGDKPLQDRKRNLEMRIRIWYVFKKQYLKFFHCEHWKESFCLTWTQGFTGFIFMFRISSAPKPLRNTNGLLSCFCWLGHTWTLPVSWCPIPRRYIYIYMCVFFCDPISLHTGIHTTRHPPFFLPGPIFMRYHVKHGKAKVAQDRLVEAIEETTCLIFWDVGSQLVGQLSCFFLMTFFCATRPHQAKCLHNDT